MVILPTEKKIDWSRPPVVVFTLLLINLLVFLWQQSNDANVYQTAIEFYSESSLPEQEWQPYVDFRIRGGDIDEPTLQEEREYLFLDLVFDPKFDEFLQETTPYYAANDATRYEWITERAELRRQVNLLSAKAYGLATHQVSVINLITYQFLHGDWMHLLGNMIFLLVCGFAVEASLGGRRFLLFYLLGGAGGGALFQLSQMNNDEIDYLVGASGSISAVMAMYVTLFRLHKIEFFYWLFVFVGYFRAPALLLLPLYIALEAVKWFITPESNIAYSAHIGGFVTGAALVALAQRFMTQSIDDDYIEQRQDEDLERKALDRVYRAIAEYEFEKALTQLELLLAKSEAKQRAQLLRVKLNLVNALGNQQKTDFLVHCIDQNQYFDGLDSAIHHWWSQLSDAEQQAIDNHQRVKIGLRLMDLDQYKASESILYQLVDSHYKQPMVAKLARRLAHFYERQGIVSRTTTMTELADSLMHSGMHDSRTQL
ncbi:rhomboid family intramembrane serine protease [Halioxenophilus aromaticivorans]|uniref:Rhomboid family intramembrane serine protease n=1 Tax=Halioxenophilus aromaticivorans TaxID=1306992 RepID=A0AAV3U370_9ALTE